MTYTEHKWQSETHFNFSYLQYLPPDFDPEKRYPLVFFLHGAGERGDDLSLVARHGYLSYDREYPFILIAPQCPKERYWGNYVESLLAFLDDVCEKLPVDRDRVILTGLSMGGNGTWLVGMAAPEKFCCLVPVCGWGIPFYAGRVANLPIWMFHGDCDTTVPIEGSMDMLRAVNSRGGNARLTVCYGVGHHSWEQAYTDEELLAWILAQRRKTE